MKKPTLNEVVDKLLSFEGKDRATMIGIGPMSHTLIKASMLLAKEKDFPLMFIASRNQVDADELGGGYVCNWDQKRFAEAIAQVAKENNFDAFSSTLFVSPYQNHEMMKDVAQKISQAVGIPFFYEDFRPGFAEGTQTSIDLELYRQPYCGCIFSEEERYSNSFKKKRKKKLKALFNEQNNK